jgi:hypothetical protein
MIRVDIGYLSLVLEGERITLKEGVVEKNCISLNGAQTDRLKEAMNSGDAFRCIDVVASIETPQALSASLLLAEVARLSDLRSSIQDKASQVAALFRLVAPRIESDGCYFDGLG